MNTAIITAAGSSTRMGQGLKKEFRKIEGKTVLYWAVFPFVKSGLFDKIIITCPSDSKDKTLDALDELTGFHSKQIFLVSGGKTRQESVFNALKFLKKDKPSTVLIHDGARPWISSEVISNVLEQTIISGAAFAAIRATSAMKTINKDNTILTNLPREVTYAAQTPQGFNFEQIYNGHKQATEDKRIYIDDTEIYTKYCGSVTMVPGSPKNIKITFSSDLE